MNKLFWAADLNKLFSDFLLGRRGYECGSFGIEIICTCLRNKQATMRIIVVWKSKRFHHNACMRFLNASRCRVDLRC
jgi:hypothetical protein